MLKTERLRHIVENIKQDGNLSVSQIADRFDVSEMTVRRDLRDLDRQGLVRRVHGGAVALLGRSDEPPYGLRSTKNVDAKRAIGRAAAEMIRDGDSVALDVGTTTLEIVPALANRRNLTLITASLPIANAVAASVPLDGGNRLILTGGIIRPGELSQIGHLAAHTYRELRVDKAFVGIGGMSLEAGLTEYHLEDALIKRVLLETARRVIVLADSSKFGRVTFAHVGAITDVDTVITDFHTPADDLERLRALGVEVIVVEY